MNFPQTNGGRSLRRGYTRDPECARTSHRLRVGHTILRALLVEPTGHDSNGTPEWPEWVTGEVFDLAYRLADETQTRRGSYLRNAPRQ